MGYNWGPTQNPIPGFIVPPPFPPVYGAFNLTSYLQGASDYEVMCALLSVVKGLYDYVANFNSDIQDKLQKYLDEQLAAFETEWNDKWAIFTATAEKNQSDFIAEYTAKVEQLVNDINEAVAALNAGNKSYTDGEIEKLQAQIDGIKNGMASTIFYNPFRGENTTLQIVFDDLATYVFKDCFTVDEYAEQDLTVENYAVKNWTVYDYAFSSKRLSGLTDILVKAPWDNNNIIGLQAAINYLWSQHQEG